VLRFADIISYYDYLGIFSITDYPRADSYVVCMDQGGVLLSVGDFAYLPVYIMSGGRFSLERCSLFFHCQMISKLEVNQENIFQIICLTVHRQ
jgi:hypothetical protein